MRRREFILGVGEVSVLAALPVARAQEAGRRYRIAILTNTPREVGLPSAFQAELDRGGFVEGGNLDVVYRGFGVAPSSLEAVAIELTRARPDVILATGPEATRATQRATTSIAIVAMANDLVASGLVASMPHPEGNTTGVAIFAFQLDVKRLELLHEHFRRLGGSVFLPIASKFRSSAPSMPPPEISALRFRTLPRGPRKRSSRRSTP
jgi:putative ABC transport system substrate-binding protein